MYSNARLTGSRVCTETRNLFREISVSFGKYREISRNFGQFRKVAFREISANFKANINENQQNYTSLKELFANCSKLQPKLPKTTEISRNHLLPKLQKLCEISRNVWPKRYTKFREISVIPKFCEISVQTLTGIFFWSK